MIEFPFSCDPREWNPTSMAPPSPPHCSDHGLDLKQRKIHSNNIGVQTSKLWNSYDRVRYSNYVYKSAECFQLFYGLNFRELRRMFNFQGGGSDGSRSVTLEASAIVHKCKLGYPPRFESMTLISINR